MCWVLSNTLLGYLASTLTQCGSWLSAANSACKRCKSADKLVCKSTASVQALVDSTSMRCTINTADSRNTWARCSKSSMCLTRSARATRMLAKGSRDSGAPALAASRGQAMASAKFKRGISSRCLAFSAHSSAKASWLFKRRSSSSFSRSGLAAPLSRVLISLKTCCNKSALGSVAIHSRKRAARSPEVGAVRAPPVRVSKEAKSSALEEGVFTSSQISKWARLRGKDGYCDRAMGWAV